MVKENGKSGVVAYSLAALCMAASSSQATVVDPQVVGLDSRVEAVRKALSASSPPSEVDGENSWRTLSQFGKSSSFSNWNNCNENNTCPK